ncbi:hypothetical protein PRZ48_006595 [Zasmidium cellare]|uniref:Enoyl reductase (ER) domain-containing protein n=1 Tax=Zasmidium cellare TaxID=395010 RepID=A0ABR0ENX4_ZASCE|nr:hypothetical protein PRZ48_006595 [Zasmidium cellare]
MASNAQIQWKIVKNDEKSNKLEVEHTEIPTPGEYEVLVKIHAVSLNFRDLMIVRGDYPFSLQLPVVPGSDGAGQVVAVGNKVTLWQKGDRVITLMNQSHLYGPVTPETASSGLGGGRDGTLRQYGTFNEQGLVRAPRNLSFAEASTLCCAGVTAWNALYGLKPVRSGQSVLVLGTGGVSLFALQFAKAAGATVIATTSSEVKAEALKNLGADHVINYALNHSWGQTAKDLTPAHQGVDNVIEVGGVRTLRESLKAVRIEGVISCIGSVSGGITDAENVPTVLDCWLNNCIARGVWVGSRAQMEDMVSVVEARDIHPIVDEKTFSIHEVKDAFEHCAQGSGFGKTVISLV